MKSIKTYVPYNYQTKAKKDNPLVYFVITLCFAILGFYAGYKCSKPAMPYTINELQRYLGVEDDGIIGPKTIAAYEQYSFNQYAAPFFTESGGKE